MAKALERMDVATEAQTVEGEWWMSATEFRAKCLGLIDEVAETGREIVPIRFAGRVNLSSSGNQI